MDGKETTPNTPEEKQLYGNAEEIASKYADVDIDDSLDGTILSNIAEPLKGEQAAINESQSENPATGETPDTPADDSNLTADKEASEDGIADAKADEQEGSVEPEDSQSNTEDANDAGGDSEEPVPATESENADKPEYVSKYAQRYRKANDRIRNAINSAKFLEEQARERIASTQAEHFDIEAAKASLAEKEEKPELLQDFTVSELVGKVNPYTGATEGGRIDQNTGDVFTPEAAEYFIARRKEINEQRQKEYDSALEEEAKALLGENKSRMDEIARRVAEDTGKLSVILDTYPELDLENPDLPPELAVLANKFWQEVAENYSDIMLGEQIMKDGFDVNRAAIDFLNVNKDYIKSFDAKWERPAAQAPKEEPKTVVSAPSGGGTSISEKPDSTREDDEITKAMSSITDKYKTAAWKRGKGL